MFVQMLGWSKLDLLARCTADAVGLGLEGVVDSTYDDDIEETDGRFVGVMISESIGHASVVMSRQAYEAFILRLLDFADGEARRLNHPVRLDLRWPVMLQARDTLRFRMTGLAAT
jgi:hypothetical protein